MLCLCIYISTYVSLYLYLHIKKTLVFFLEHSSGILTAKQDAQDAYGNLK